MPLRGKILVVLFVTLALLVAGLYALANFTVMRGFVELEADSMRLDVRRVRDALAQDVLGLVEKSGDWAYWDDMYHFIEVPDPRFVQSNVNISAASSMRLDGIIVVDIQGRPLISRGFNRAGQTDTALQDALVDAMLPGAILNPTPGTEKLTQRKPGSDSAVLEEDRLIVIDPPHAGMATCAGVMHIDGQFYLAASRPVLRSDQTGPPVGRVAFIRRFDQANIDELAARTHVKITSTPFTPSSRSVRTRPARPASSSLQPSDRDSGNAAPASPVFTLPDHLPDPERIEFLRDSPKHTLLVTPLDAHYIIGETIVYDIDGQAAFVLRVEAFRNIVTRGRQSMRFFTYYILASGLAFGFVTYLAIDRLVLARLLRLSGDIQSIGKTGASTGRVQKEGSDELASLAEAINHTLAAIDSSQQLLRQREAEARKLALVAARTDNTVVITDPQGKIEWVNEGFTRQTGYTLAEVVGKRPGDFLQGRDTDPATVLHMRQQLAMGKGFHVEVLNYNKQGREYWLDVEVQPMYDEAGKLINFMAIESDITESKRLTQELRNARDAAEAANRAKSQFLANMSHEIRTPMTAILGFAELLNDPLTTPEQRDLYNHSIVRNGHHLLAIINDILDLSKIEADKMTIEQVPTSITQILAEVMAVNQQSAAEKKLALSVRYLTPIPASITCDPYRLRQIVTNLVSNAVKFTERGSVTVSVSMLDEFSAEHPRVRLDVQDTGPGISPQQQSGLFRPFTQADTSTTRRFGGTGLGLTISRRLAQLLGGDITLESAVGHGSTFTLVLPTGPLRGVEAIADPVSDQASRAGPDQQKSNSQRGPDKIRPLEGASILLAEDGLDNQRLIGFLLTHSGAQVAFAANGRAAVDQTLDAIARGTPPDIILMDMQMPELDGYSATRLLREKGVKITIIALTAHAMASDREKCLQAGCDDYMTKPINRERMLNLLSDHLDRIRAGR